jgi:thiosulfate dehydrogenase [quinone] large subunit
MGSKEVQPMPESSLSRSLRFSTVYLRLALGITFLTAVTDRFGLWGPPGATNVAWGDFSHFLAYAQQLNPYVSPSWMPAVGWIVTVAETLLGLALLLGFHTRMASRLSGFLLLAFALGMTIGTGVKSALNASVFSASGGAFVLGEIGTYPWSWNAWRGRGERI